jgi:hypothetical protein
VNEEQAGRLRAALEYVTEHPREWVQEYYAVRTPCGTMACLAGWIALQAGCELSGWIPMHYYDRGTDTYVPMPETEKSMAVMFGRLDDYRDGDDLFDRDGDGSFKSGIATVAAHLIGLGWLEAEALFAASNSLRHLWEHAARFSGGLIEVPADLPEWADLTVSDVDRPAEPATFVAHVAAYLDQVERGTR